MLPVLPCMVYERPAIKQGDRSGFVLQSSSQKELPKCDRVYLATVSYCDRVLKKNFRNEIEFNLRRFQLLNRLHELRANGSQPRLEAFVRFTFQGGTVREFGMVLREAGGGRLRIF